MWFNSVKKACKDHCLEYVLLLVITMMGFYIISLEVTYTGSFQLIHAVITGFFGVVSIVYPAMTCLKDYFDATVKAKDTKGDERNGEVRVE